MKMNSTLDLPQSSGAIGRLGDSWLQYHISTTQLACLAGLTSHLYFGRGYRDQEAVQILGTGIAAFFAFCIASVYSHWEDGPLSLIIFIWSNSSAFLGSLFFSIVIYRLLFHRIRKFPGPFWAKISKFYIAKHSADLKQHLHIKELHSKYGDWVRTGPREISVTTAEAVSALYGPKSKCSRGPWYGMSNHADTWSLHTTQDRNLHRQRRRVWDRAFSTKALNEYLPKVVGHTDTLVDQIARQSPNPVRLDHWFNYYSFDVMGDLGFSKDFGMLEGGQAHSAIKALHAALRSVRPLSAVPWTTRIILKFSHGSLHEFLDWCYQRTLEKKNSTAESKDIFSWLLADEETGIKMTKGIMQAEGRLIIVAGSDTTAVTLTNLFYNLVSHPEVTKKLQQEIDGLFTDEPNAGYESLQKLQYLQAVVNETLRLFPAVPSGLERVTPPEGLEIAGVYVPGEIVISVPMWTVNRDERNYPNPDEFIPERWTSSPELNPAKNLFFPFSQGRDSCIGKNLALMEINMVVASLLRRFDLVSSDPKQLTSYVSKSQDTFTLCAPDLSVSFIPRVK